MNSSVSTELGIAHKDKLQPREADVLAPSPDEGGMWAALEQSRPVALESPTALGWHRALPLGLQTRHQQWGSWPVGAAHGAPIQCWRVIPGPGCAGPSVQLEGICWHLLCRSHACSHPSLWLGSWCDLAPTKAFGTRIGNLRLREWRGAGIEFKCFALLPGGVCPSLLLSGAQGTLAPLRFYLLPLSLYPSFPKSCQLQKENEYVFP